ncbi:T9SS type A sorting domain-containing protein [Saccharicrinis aurantiacus]|uniref:T9SS type A sorting domain-containing protein n=1 Tax=Saccharicrinis aurantiacus TaxID=1849719 RepID=UPI0024910D89|nr:T9SS type A sorting domain-containing protein [Saccharicrinis aurantiacus]
MKTKLLLPLFIISFGLFTLNTKAQLLNQTTFGFEDTNGITYLNTSGNIIEAWTSEQGFTQSSEQKHSGSYSVKAIIDGTTQPKLKTANATNGEGTFDLEAANYVGKIWVYLVGAVPRTIKATLKEPGNNNAFIFRIADVTERNKWVELSSQNSVILDSPTSNNSFIIVMQDNPDPLQEGSIVYFDDLNIYYDVATQNNTKSQEIISMKQLGETVLIKSENPSDIVIYSITGAIKESLSKTEDDLYISTQNYSSGMYIIKVVSGGKSLVKKIAIQ